MSLPFASQHPIVRLWVVASSMIVGVFVVLAGGSLMLASSLGEAYSDVWEYPITKSIGLGSVAVTWLVYIAAMVVLLGYEDAVWRRAFVLLMFLGCIAFLVFIVWTIGVPFHFNGTQSVL